MRELFDTCTIAVCFSSNRHEGSLRAFSQRRHARHVDVIKNSPVERWICDLCEKKIKKNEKR